MDIQSQHLSCGIFDQPQLWQELEVDNYTFPVYYSGVLPSEAHAAVLCLHPRCSTATAFLQLTRFLATGTDNDTHLALLAPSAPDNHLFWSPNLPFDTPLEMLQPYLEISLTVIEQLCQKLAEHVPIENISVFGFANSACVALEYAVRCGYPLNAVLALSGLLLGTNLESTERFTAASPRTKVLITCSSTVSAAIRARFRQSEQLLKQFGYKVVALTYERRPDTILPDELVVSRKVLYGDFA